MRQAIFLDRDGVINDAIIRQGLPYPPANLAELEILPGVADSLIQLRQAGFMTIIVTNQPDVARQIQTIEAVEAIHSALLTQLAIDDIRVCYHDNSANCQCRKPKPGMLVKAAEQYHIDLTKSYMIGDRWRDIQAGESAGCTTIFIDYNYAETNHSTPDFTVSSLSEAALWILKRGKSS